MPILRSKMDAKPELIDDRNARGGALPSRAHASQVADETLRDGLQSPSVTDPPIATKIRLLHLMDRLGIQTADIGLPGAGPRHVESAKALAREIVAAKLAIRPNCAARTLARDIQPIAD